MRRSPTYFGARSSSLIRSQSPIWATVVQNSTLGEVRSVPTVIVFDTHGREVLRKYGAFTDEELDGWLTRAPLTRIKAGARPQPYATFEPFAPEPTKNLPSSEIPATEFKAQPVMSVVPVAVIRSKTLCAPAVSHTIATPPSGAGITRGDAAV